MRNKYGAVNLFTCQIKYNCRITFIFSLQQHNTGVKCIQYWKETIYLHLNSFLCLHASCFGNLFKATQIKSKIWKNNFLFLRFQASCYANSVSPPIAMQVIASMRSIINGAGLERVKTLARNSNYFRYFGILIKLFGLLTSVHIVELWTLHLKGVKGKMWGNFEEWCGGKLSNAIF